MIESLPFNPKIKITQELLHAAHMIIQAEAMSILQSSSLLFSQTLPDLQTMSQEERVHWAEETIGFFTTLFLEIGIPGGMIKEVITRTVQQYRLANLKQYVRTEESDLESIEKREAS